MTARTRAFSLAALAASLASLPRAAAAAPPTTQACIAAFDDGQRARSDGRLLAARDRLLVCSQKECPGVLREDCAGVLREVERATPTIVLAASDGNGRDLTDVTVTLGGRPLTDRLDGRPIAVDPGKLVLRFEHKPFDPVTMELVVAEGQKDRTVRAVLGRPDERRAEPPEPIHPFRRSFAGWAVPIGLGVVGLGALGFAGVTRIRLGNEADDMRATCAPTCPQTDRDRMSNDLVAANVALGIGLATVALAAVAWFLFEPRPARTRSVGLAW